jgi:NitT/TauT family transport system ATP-binding protein
VRRRVDGRPVAVKLKLRGVSKQFVLRNQVVPAVQAIDLEVRQDEFLALVGPSGCGKTTLLRILAGLERQSAGDIEVMRDAAAPTSAGQPLNAMVFQEHGVFPWMTARDNVAFGLKARGFGKARRYAIADRFIDSVGLTAFRDAYPHQLSGGMKQRVSIARAFANDPEILLMDEPFAALDEQTRIILQTQLLRIWEESRKTVVYVTHSLDEAIVLADRVVVMTHRPGRIKEIIAIDAVFPRPRRVEDIKSSARYGELFGRLWAALRDEVMFHEHERQVHA